MTEKRQFRAIKGTRDILPPDSALWNWFEQSARSTFERYGFRDIRTPIFEETELFARSIGVETDVVGKEMYTFEDHDLPELESWRGKILMSQGFPGNLSPTSDYVREIRAFLDRVKSLSGAGEGKIPKTPENIKAVENAAHFLDALANPALTTGEVEVTLAQALSNVQNLAFGDVLSLRPEATASVCRAYIEHGMHTLPGNVKLYYIGPMFRRERPQKGRYRQFYQIGAEVLGQSDAPAVDAEVIEMLLTFFRRVGLSKTTLYINSIGDKNCRPQYVELLRAELRKVKDKLKEDSQRRIDTNPLRVLDSKLPEEQPIIEQLPRIADHLCAECRDHFAKLKEELKLRNVAFEENWRLVRGLDYYTRTTFEVIAAGLGSQNAVCGGGRYDGLAELLGGPPTKGIGFAIGSDRCILSIQETGSLPPLPGLTVFIAWMGAASYSTAVGIARKLRDCGLSVELPPEEMKFKKSLALADKLGARYALIIGEDEVASRTFTLKRLADADQKKLTEQDLLEYLESEKRGTGA
ncbi:MAG TPA: histidine--tRNA ligase [Candidatus Limnocylindrales bacterium]|nr:histidine--tRNA ligase [Candidatus Limnocylindrales bacterium]